LGVLFPQRRDQGLLLPQLGPQFGNDLILLAQAGPPAVQNVNTVWIASVP